jgi:hypothetical protein
MNASSDNSNSFNESTRCQHRTPSGKRCRLQVVDALSGLCLRHGSQRLVTPDTNLRAALVGDLEDFKSAENVNEVLGRLLVLLSEDRIAPRRGAVLAYVCNLLLHSLVAIDREAANQPIHVDWSNVPRPDRDPEPAYDYSHGGRPQS